MTSALLMVANFTGRSGHAISIRIVWKHTTHSDVRISQSQHNTHFDITDSTCVENLVEEVDGIIQEVVVRDGKNILCSCAHEG